tara:strand:- start:1251 stop:1424 length:174 start_codon:yes stop_codon:yes gene_type:complete
MAYKQPSNRFKKMANRAYKLENRMEQAHDQGNYKKRDRLSKRLQKTESKMRGGCCGY